MKRRKSKIDGRHASERGQGGYSWVVPAVLVVALLVVFALLYDMRTVLSPSAWRDPDEWRAEELAELLLRENMRTYRDQAGRFKVNIPATWSVRDNQKNVSGYDVVFRSPHGFELSIMVNEWDGGFEQLERDIQGIEERYGLNMNIRRTNLHGRTPALRRMVILRLSRVLSLDFVKDGLAHHIQITMPHTLADEAEPYLEALFSEYHPLPQPQQPQ